MGLVDRLSLAEETSRSWLTEVTRAMGLTGLSSFSEARTGAKSKPKVAANTDKIRSLLVARKRNGFMGTPHTK
jgi:hypothetical protein